MGQIESNGTRRRVLEPRWLCLLLRPARRRLKFGPVDVRGREHLRPCARRIRPSFPRPGGCQTENAARTSPVPVHLHVEPAHSDWRWRERPALALLAWEALAGDPLATLCRSQVESTGTTINFRPAA